MIVEGLNYYMAFSVCLDQTWFTRTARYAKPAPGPLVTSVLNLDFKVRAYPNWLKHVALEWQVPSGSPALVFHVYILRSEGDFERLTESPVTGTFFINSDSEEYSKFRAETYIVEAIDPTTGASFKSRPTTWENPVRTHVEKRLFEIQRREYLLMSKFSGVKSFLFRRKYFGPHCPRCWNPTQEAVVDDMCPVCYGTGYEGGYFDPVPLYLQYEPTPSNRTLTPYGKAEPNSISAWTISMPNIQPEDLIIRMGDFTVYEVSAIQTTEIQAKTVRQILSLSQAPRRGVEARLLSRLPADDSGGYLDLTNEVFPSRNDKSHITSTTQDDPEWAAEAGRDNLPQKYVL